MAFSVYCHSHSDDSDPDMAMAAKRDKAGSA